MLRLYLHKQKVIIPTVAETEAGFYIDAKPVRVFKVTEVDRFKQELFDHWREGNPVVPTPEGDDEPGSAILEELHIGKWSTFEKSSCMFTLHKGPRYVSIYCTGKGDDGMWSHAATERRIFDPRVPFENVIEAVVKDVIQHPDAMPPRPTGLMLAAPKD